jgi:hypothetical protein
VSITELHRLYSFRQIRAARLRGEPVNRLIADLASAAGVELCRVCSRPLAGRQRSYCSPAHTVAGTRETAGNGWLREEPQWVERQSERAVS